MHSTFLFPSFLCLIVSVVFLFFSLSYSLLIMTPKKTIPSKNSIRRGSFSSSFPPDFVWFRDEKIRNDFFENFSNREIHSERHVILFDFSNTSLPGAISSRGWASLCEKPSRCPNVFIQVFYSNMHVIDTFVPQFTIVFYGTRILVNPYFISEVLQVPRVDRPDYTSIVISLPSLETSWLYSSVRRSCCGKVPLISP